MFEALPMDAPRLWGAIDQASELVEDALALDEDIIETALMEDDHE